MPVAVNGYESIVQVNQKPQVERAPVAFPQSFEILRIEDMTQEAR